MASRLESENDALRQQLEDLLAEARRNEDKMRRFNQLERRLIGAGSIVELVSLLLEDYRDEFAIDEVTLSLVDPDDEVRKILDDNSTASAIDGLILIESASEITPLYEGVLRPRLEPFDSAIHADLFSAPANAVGSVALLPLVRHNALIGSLHFRSAHPERYTSDYGTDFLERLSGIVAICLDSALSHERIKQMGLTDALTGVNNRRYFEHRCAIEVSQARRHQRALTCMFVDIDRFKRINDTYGHQTGDEILRSVARTIQAQLRAGDTIARYGGEEFVVLLPHTELLQARLIAERFRASIEQNHFDTISGKNLKATISVGVSELILSDPDSDDLSLSTTMITSADHALYRAKNNGRNRVEWHDNATLPSLRPTQADIRNSVTHGISAIADRIRGSIKPARPSPKTRDR